MIDLKKNQKGFSLIETIIYIALLGVIISFITSLLVNVMASYNRSQASKIVSNNISLAVDTISKDIRDSKEIYTPTSVFNSDLGQLSLITTFDPPGGHTQRFIDFYLDNGVIYKKKEGYSEYAITSERVFIEKLKFENILSGTRDTIKITIDGRINTSSTKPEYQYQESVTSTASLRENY